MLQLLLFGCIVFPLIAAVAVALDKEGTLRRRIVYAGTGITALSALGLALYGSFVLPISPDSSLQPLMTVLDLALLVFILYVAVNIRHRLSMGLALGQLAGMIYLDFFMLEGHQATAFLADPLALVMVLVISLVGGIVCIFGLGYMQEHEDHLRLAKSKQSRFFFFLLLFLGAMNGLVLCDSLTWVFFFWEITTLCSFFLISHDGTREAKRNATRALWMNMVGGIGFLAAMLFMQKAIGTLSIQAMLAQSVVMHSTAAMLPVAFLCFAAFTKSAQLPFQSWLCGAMVAPTPVSALLHSSHDGQGRRLPCAAPLSGLRRDHARGHRFPDRRLHLRGRFRPGLRPEQRQEDPRLLHHRQPRTHHRVRRHGDPGGHHRRHPAHHLPRGFQGPPLPLRGHHRTAHRLA